MPKLKKYTGDQIFRILESSERPWDKQEFETELSYRAFANHYLALPASDRSMAEAYRHYLKSVGRKNWKTAPVANAWYTWHKEHHWEFRVAAYDLKNEHEMRQYANYDQYVELVEFRKKQAHLARNLTDAANLMLEKALVALQELDGTELTRNNIPLFIKTASQVAEMASNAEANALTLNELIERLSVEENWEVVDVEAETIGNSVNDEDTEYVMLELLEDIDHG